MSKMTTVGVLVALALVLTTGLQCALAAPLNDTSIHLKTSANEPTGSKTSGNLYGTGNDAGGAANPQQGNNRGYNQGYSYNTGIKPYTTGYTYYQPFGDAVNNHDNGTAGDGKPAQMPVQMPNIFGIDPKQMGPVRVIPNQNVPVDANGIPILDAIPMQPINNGQSKGAGVGLVQNQPRAAPVPMPVNVPPMNTNDFAMPNDFNLNNILSSGGGGGGGGGGRTNFRPQNNYNPASDNSMFDFAPPSSNNFDFGQQNGGDQRDYSRLDNFAGNLNNFDTYLGDPSLMMDNPSPPSSAQTPNGLSSFGFDGQQVPSEIVNLNNAFGTGNNNNQANGGNLNDILNQFGGSGGGTNTNSQPGDEFGNFGSSSGSTPMFPFL